LGRAGGASPLSDREDRGLTPPARLSEPPPKPEKCQETPARWLGPNPTMILVANSRKRPTSRSLARMGPLGNGNPASPTARTNSPPVSLLGLPLFGDRRAVPRAPRLCPGGRESSRRAPGRGGVRTLWAVP